MVNHQRKDVRLFLRSLFILSLFHAFTLSLHAQEMKLHTIHNKGNHDIEMSVINYGARIQSLKVDGTDIVLGFDTLENYAKVKQNFGAVVGRYIGRILGGNLNIDGQHYQLQTGSNGDTSHGGTPGFSQQYWEFVDSAKTDSTVVLRYVSPDGENGFPGQLTLDVTYTITHDALKIGYTATTTKPTVLNPSNHTFFNLTGDLSKDILNEELYIRSDSIALYDSNKRVTGKLGSVKNTPFDFNEQTAIGRHIDDDNEQLAITKGYDHCYKLRYYYNSQYPLHEAAVLYDPNTKIAMHILTTEPAMQIYTANGHKGNIIGKEGKRYPRRNAICFETMHFPDSPNKPQWPSTLLRPGETFQSATVFMFE